MNARVSVFSVSVDCPKCGESLPEPQDGSLVWERSQIHGQYVSCSCGEVVKVVLPKWVR